jgi:hypothetical protein
MYADNLIETDFRKVVKYHQQTEIALELLAREWHSKQNNISKYSRIPIKVNWTKTLNILHNNIKMTSLTTLLKQTRYGSYLMRLFNGMLPTMDVMHRRNKEIYPDDMCKLCQQASEDNIHIWECPKNEKTIEDIFRKGYLQLIRLLKTILTNSHIIGTDEEKLLNTC